MAVSEHRKQVKNVQKRIYRAQDMGYVFSDEFKQSINGLSTETLLAYDSDFVRSQAINFHEKGQLVKPGKPNPVKANMPGPKKTSAEATKVEAKKATNATNKSVQPKQTTAQSASKAKQTAKPNLDTEPQKTVKRPQTEKKRRELHRIRQQISDAEKRGYIFEDTLKDALSSWNTNRLKKFTNEKVYAASKFKFGDEVVTGTKGSQIERSRRSKKAADTMYGKEKGDYNAWVLLTFFKDTIKKGVYAFLDKLPRKIDTHKKWWQFWLVDPVAEELRRKGYRGEAFKKERERILKEITDEIDRERWEREWKQDTADYEDFLRNKIEKDKISDEQDRIDKELGRYEKEGGLYAEDNDYDYLRDPISEAEVIYSNFMEMMEDTGTLGYEYLHDLFNDETNRYGQDAVLKALSQMSEDEIKELQTVVYYKEYGMSGSEVHRILRKFGEAIKGAAFTKSEAKQLGNRFDKMDDDWLYFANTTW